MSDFWPFAGRFHPLLVHFPIALLLAAALLDLAALWRARRPGAVFPSPASRVVLVLGALSAIGAVVTGYALGTSGGYGGPVFERHLYFGVWVALAASLAVLTRLLVQEGRFWRVAYASLLAATAMVLAIAGHLGATLTHGEGYLTDHAPAPIRHVLQRLTGQPPAAPRHTGPADQAVAYAALVAPILQERCVSCHGPGKAEGGLRLDTPDGIRKGGGDGPVVAPGRAASSELVRRVWLPAGHEDAMPPKGRPPLTPAEASVLRWWIDEGADATQKLADMDVPPDVLPAIETALGPLNRGGPTIPLVAVEAADAAALAAIEAEGLSLAPVAIGSPFLQAHCTNAGPRVGDEAMTVLARVAPQLLWLDLSGSGVTDAGLAALARFPNLTRLHLNRTAVTDAGLAHLGALPRLEYLNLYGTRVTDAGLTHLAGLTKLQALYVWQTGVTETGAQRLRSALPRLLVELGQPAPPSEPARSTR